jgi:hypothetical protein
MSRLADILQNEYKTKGVFSGASSAVGKRALEKLDIRNALFSGGGIGSAVGTKIFGKGYSATRGSKTTTPTNETLSSGPSPLLQEININSKITAKNSMALPAMAKQMNIMQKNIAKLVKIWGGSPSTKADSFFSNSKFRENQYESQFNKGTKPTKVEEKEKSSGGFLGMLSSLASGIMSVIGGVVSAVSKSIGSLSRIFTTIGIAAASLGAAFVSVLGFLASTRIGKLLGITAALTAGAYKFLGGSPKLNTGDVEAQDGGFYGEPPREPGMEKGKELGREALTSAGVLGLGAITGRARPSSPSSMPTSTPSPASSGGKPLSDFGSVGKNREMEKNKTFFQKIVDVILKASKQGQITAMLKKLSQTFGYKIAAKIGSVIAGIIAAPAGGVSLLLSVIGFAMLASDILALYEWFIEYEKELDAYNKSLSPSSVSVDPSSVDYSPAADAMSGSTTTAPIISPSSPSTTPSSTTASSTTPTKSSMLDLIASGESGKAGYDAANKGKAGDMPNGLPGLSNMKVGDVMRLQQDKKLFAAGRYQIIPDTLAGLISGKYGNTGVTINDTFNAETQDKLGQALINARLKQGGGDPIKTQLALSQEFASIANPYTGKSYYEGKGNNKASISTEQIQASLSGTGTKIDGSVLASASAAKESAASQSMFTPEDLAALANVMGSQTMINGGGGLKEVITASKSTPYEKEFYSNMVNKIAL